MSLKHEPILGVGVHQHTVIAERLLRTFCTGKSMKVNDTCLGGGELIFKELCMTKLILELSEFFLLFWC